MSLTRISRVIYLWISFYAQFWIARDGIWSSGPISAQPTLSMHATLAADPEMKTRFKAFAIGQYISESILFLDDAETFKRLFFEKGRPGEQRKHGC